MSLLKGIDRMRDMLLEKRNVLRAGFRPTTRCCGGARHGQIVAGQALHARVNARHARCKGGDGQLKLIEIHRQDIESLPDLMVLMRGAPYRFIVHLDTALVGPRKAFAKCNRRKLVAYARILGRCRAAKLQAAPRHRKCPVTISAAPSKQQRRRNAMAARGRRYQPRTSATMLSFSSSDQRRLRPFQPTNLRTVRKTSHTHCLQRSTSLWQGGGARRRLTVYRVRDAPGVRPLQSDYCACDPRFRRLSTSPAKVTAQ